MRGGRGAAVAQRRRAGSTSALLARGRAPGTGPRRGRGPCGGTRTRRARRASSRGARRRRRSRGTACRTWRETSSRRPTMPMVGVGRMRRRPSRCRSDTLPETTGVSSARQASAMPRTAAANCAMISGLSGLPKFRQSVTASGRAPDARDRARRLGHRDRAAPVRVRRQKKRVDVGRHREPLLRALAPRRTAASPPGPLDRVASAPCGRTASRSSASARGSATRAGAQARAVVVRLGAPSSQRGRAPAAAPARARALVDRRRSDERRRPAGRRRSRPSKKRHHAAGVASTPPDHHGVELPLVEDRERPPPSRRRRATRSMRSCDSESRIS